MQDTKAGQARCRQTGRLIAKSNCFALRCEDGGEFWLEMDRIPHHLIDQRVDIDGILFGKSLIAVEGIGPAPEPSRLSPVPSPALPARR